MNKRQGYKFQYRGLLLPVSVVLIISCMSCRSDATGEDKASERALEASTEVSGVPASVSDAGFDFDLTGLPPSLRSELKKIKVLVVKDRNVDDIWLLSGQPESVDLVILACSPQSLSTDMITLVKQWASKGRGIVITKDLFTAVWSHLFPAGFMPIVHNYSAQLLTVKGQPVTAQVARVHNFLWCAANKGYMGIVRTENIGPYAVVMTHSEIVSVFAQQGEEFSPLIVQDESSPRDIGTSPLILFTTTWKGARIAWLTGTIASHPGATCQLEADDARLWSNLAHWLAGK